MGAPCREPRARDPGGIPGLPLCHLAGHCAIRINITHASRVTGRLNAIMQSLAVVSVVPDCASLCAGATTTSLGGDATHACMHICSSTSSPRSVSAAGDCTIIMRVTNRETAPGRKLYLHKVKHVCSPARNSGRSSASPPSTPTPHGAAHIPSSAPSKHPFDSPTFHRIAAKPAMPGRRLTASASG